MRTGEWGQRNEDRGMRTGELGQRNEGRGMGTGEWGQAVDQQPSAGS
jgi:hypothetical protein